MVFRLWARFVGEFFSVDFRVCVYFLTSMLRNQPNKKVCFPSMQCDARNG